MAIKKPGPCPACDSVKGPILTGWRYDFGGCMDFQVCCNDCMYDGPIIMSSGKKAVEAWGKLTEKDIPYNKKWYKKIRQDTDRYRLEHQTPLTPRKEIEDEVVE